MDINWKCLLTLAKEDPSAKEDLINHFTPIIKKAIKYYNYNHKLYDDIYQECVLLILTLLEKYDVDSKTPFPYIVKKHLYSYIKCFVSKELSLNENIISIHSPIYGCDDISLEDTISSSENIEMEYIFRENVLEIISIIETLPLLEREILTKYYFSNKKLKDIAVELDISYRYAKKIKYNAIEKITRYYNL